jgi:hypothetical protein
MDRDDHDLQGQEAKSRTQQRCHYDVNNKLVNMQYTTLPDGTQYASETVMDLPSEGLKVEIMNDGFKKSAARQATPLRRQ